MFIFLVTRTIKAAASFESPVFLFFCSFPRSHLPAALSSTHPKLRVIPRTCPKLRTLLSPRQIFVSLNLSIGRSRWSHRREDISRPEEPQNTRHLCDDCPSRRVWQRSRWQHCSARQTLFTKSRDATWTQTGTRGDRFIALLLSVVSRHRSSQCAAHSETKASLHSVSGKE